MFDVVKDFPKKGIIFLDIFPLFEKKDFVKVVREKLTFDYPLTAVAVPEARGFLLGGMVYALNGYPLLPFRKQGKLPYSGSDAPKKITYDNEYASDTLEYRLSDFERVKAQTSEVIILDDILATGKTAEAMSQVLIAYGFKIREFVFLASIPDLEGKDILSKIAPVKLLFDEQ